MQRVIVFGNGQPAETNYFFLTHSLLYEVAAFTVDRAYIKENKLFGLPVVPFEDIESIYSPNEYKMSLLMSYRNLNKLRAEKYYQAKEKGYELISYVSPHAVTWPGLVIGDNCFIGDYSVISPFVEIGNNIQICSGSNVGHHCVIKDHCFISPGAVILGSATIEPYCLIGANSTIRDGGITIARECIIGAGVLINANTKERGVYINKRPELLSKPSDKLSTLLTWAMKPHKPGRAPGPKEREKK
ncbi:MAG TPA: acetyltransferase [Chryseolinea sp.]|nr:acetyltransferase [Chryseolinea sp.]